EIIAMLIHRQENDSLKNAIGTSNLEKLEKLLQNSHGRLKDSNDTLSERALFIAIEKGKKIAVEWLLLNKEYIDMNDTDIYTDIYTEIYQDTALIKAIKRNQYEIAHILASRDDFDVNYRNKAGEGALFLAAFYRDT